jgi:hypothetical protein
MTTTLELFETSQTIHERRPFELDLLIPEALLVPNISKRPSVI